MDLIHVDCENVGLAILEDKLKDVINTKVVFVVGKAQSCKKYYKIVPSANTEIIKSGVVASNASDFLLITDLVSKLLEGRYNRAIILTHDTGFDAAVQYLRLQGFDVIRQTPENFATYSGIRELCKFIKDNCKSGWAFYKLEETCKEHFKSDSRISDKLRHLRQLGIIRCKTVNNLYRVYFSKKKLEEVAENNNVYN